MKQYQVEFSDTAESELIESIIWGSAEWGSEETFQWARNLRKSVNDMLGSFPKSQPLAPESDEAGTEIRHMIIGRYRILFNIEGNVVNVLHVRGAFRGTT
jgi:plasmid stabilization system protein ParE